MSDPLSERDPVLSAIGRQLVAGVATYETRRRQRRRRVAAAALAVAVVAGVVSAGVVLADRRQDVSVLEAVGTSTTAPADTGAGGSDVTGATTEVAPVLGTGPITVVANDGEPLDPTDPAVAVIVAEVESQLLSDDRFLGIDEARRRDLVADGGLVVHTTIRAEAQRLAEEARVGVLGQDDVRVAGALVAVDPATGAIVAMLGDAPEWATRTDPDADPADPAETGSLNLATTGLSMPAGDAFAPVLLAAAFEDGRLPEDTIDGTGPCEFEVPDQPDPYRVVNGGGVGGVATISEQVATDGYCAWMRLGLDVGLETLGATAARLGLATAPEPYPSLPLGAVDVSPLELVTINATLAAGGVRHDPYLIAEIKQDGRYIYTAGVGPGTSAIDPATACRVTASLRLVGEVFDLVPAAGVGTAASPFTGAVYVPAYTSDLATVVWVQPDPSEPVPAPGAPTAADVLASRIWYEFIRGYVDLTADPAPFPDCPAAPRAPERITTAWD